MYPANKGFTSRRALRRFTSTHTTVVIIGGKSTCTAVRSIPYSSVRRDTSSFRMTPRHVYRTTRWPHRTVPDNLRVNRFIRTQTRSLARGQRRPRAHLAVNVRIKGPMCTSSGQRAHRQAQPARHQARTSPHGSGRTCSRPGFPSWHNWQRASPGTSHAPPPHAPADPKHVKGPGLVAFSRTRPGPQAVTNRITRGSSCQSRWRPAHRGSPRTQSRHRSRLRSSSSSPWLQPSARR